MPKYKQLTIRLDPKLHIMAQLKCKNQLGIGLSPLIKMFLRSFVTQKGVGFYVGDDDLCSLFSDWLRKKRMEIGRKGCAPMPGPRLKDIYDLNL